MINKLVATGMSLALFLLIGAGCASQSENAAPQGKASEQKPLSEIGNSIWYAIKNPTIETQKDGYTTFTFANGSGTCVDKGLEEFSIYFDEERGFAKASANDQRDLSLGMFFTSESRISGITTNEGKVTCTALPKEGQNEVPFTCKLDATDTEYCTGTYQGTAKK